MDNFIKYSGEYHIKVINKVTCEVVRDDVIKNMVTDLALNKLINVLKGDDSNMEVAYFALGDSTTAVSASQTTLGNEIFRTAFLSKWNSGTGQVTSSTYIIDTEVVGTIEEMGIFCGPSATITADTGNMLSRILWHHVKTSLEEIQVTRVDTISRA
jgi:hypothetical protein